MALATKIPATLIPGDGIGPEIMDAVLMVLGAVDAPFEWDRQVGGLAGIEACGDPLPRATLDSIRRTRLALKGPLTTPDAAIFEAVHGSAPDIAGKGLANPLALLLAACLMLDHVGRAESAGRIRKAMLACLNTDGVRTPDLGGKASTADFAQGIVRRLN